MTLQSPELSIAFTRCKPNQRSPHIMSQPSTPPRSLHSTIIPIECIARLDATPFRLGFGNNDKPRKAIHPTLPRTRPYGSDTHRLSFGAPIYAYTPSFTGRHLQDQTEKERQRHPSSKSYDSEPVSGCLNFPPSPTLSGARDRIFRLPPVPYDFDAPFDVQFYRPTPDIASNLSHLQSLAIATPSLIGKVLVLLLP